MKRRRKTAAAVLALTFVVLAAGLANAQSEEIFTQARAAMSLSGLDRLTSYCSATQYSMRYTDWMYVGDAQMVGYLVTVSGCGATSIASSQIQFALEDPTAGNVRYGTAGAQGFPLSSGWYRNDTGTSVTSTSADCYITTAITTAPFARLGFHQAKADDGDVKFTILAFKRRNNPYYTPEDVLARDDMIAGDDIIGGGDLTVGGIAGVGGGTAVKKWDVTSGTIVAGETSCTLTLPWAYTVGRDYPTWSIMPNDTRNLYAGHGDDSFHPEGGTAAEVRITSQTFSTLVVTVEMKRRW